jgi:hypothetical protein
MLRADFTYRREQLFPVMLLTIELLKSLLSTRELSGYVQTKLTQTRVRLDSRIYDLNVDRKR